ncbi:putative DNA polymerase III, delta subunit [Leptospira interrogans serovar Hebdomadis str. R499]|nr:putative DNA polymerase III, delta subunit [Leptospira interrogans serovar Pomona str. Kennewicki LC82-25]EKN97672.1 putative DNA polymerase III, delta subunit [Leptospira interrogans serovar Pomona str. Pomona]EKO69267.1 putative DNA polymerase III, delta subunit [Leptospira interrogans serovar Canicola str. Fiocruz LV133]EKR35827.1 putative DNA polymerase III, delta subunit [Leptospira interrogans serovar Hebdomadis str. R499]EMF34097.1 putative DNA polymerase III, delta subunit [Leptospir
MLLRKNRMATKTKEYKNSIEFLNDWNQKLPQIVFVAAKESYEFEILAEKYKDSIRKTGESHEIVIFVSEPGDFERFQSEAFNLDIFSNRKLFIIKSGLEFFKPISTGKGKNNESLQKQFSNFPDSIQLLIHYNHWEVPNKVLQIFGGKANLIKTKNFYPNETRGGLLQACKEIGVQLDEDAIDEFLHKIPPSMGAYLQSLSKLKLYLSKKIFTKQDIEDVLLFSGEFNSSGLVDFFMESDRIRFFKELKKFQSGKDSLLLFFSILKEKIDQLRKYKIISKKYETSLSDEELHEFLGTQSYSPARKNFVRNRLKKEATFFSDKTIGELYDFLIDMNIRIKTNSEKEESLFYFKRRMEDFFLQLRRKDRIL